MITLKIVALCALGVGTIVGLLSSQFGPDLVLGLFTGLL